MPSFGSTDFIRRGFYRNRFFEHILTTASLTGCVITRGAVALVASAATSKLLRRADSFLNCPRKPEFCHSATTASAKPINPQVNMQSPNRCRNETDSHKRVPRCEGG